MNIQPKNRSLQIRILKGHMKTIKSAIFLVSLFFVQAISAQTEKTIEIDIASRNEAIKLSNSGNRKLKAKMYAEAIPFFEQSIAKDSTMKDTYEMAYYAAMYLEKPVPEVVSLIKKGQRVYPQDDSFPFYLGDLYRVGNNYPLAVKEYSKAIELSKLQEELPVLINTYYFNRATTYIKIKNYKAAIADYKICLKSNPDNPFANLNLGNCYHNLGQEDNARIYWRKAASLGNDAARQYLTLSEKRR